MYTQSSSLLKKNSKNFRCIQRKTNKKKLFNIYYNERQQQNTQQNFKNKQI